MQRLTEIAIAKANNGAFTRPELAAWVGGGSARQSGVLKRALAAGEIVRVHRGLYCLANRFLPARPDPLPLAQRICGPSYVSLETALSLHGWIPEAVYTVTCVCLERSREFDTPLGRFSFTRVPQQTFYAEVDRVEAAGASYLLATPAKALADYVYVRRLDWTSARPLVESLRVEPARLASLSPDTLSRLAANYASRRVRRFLQGLRKDIAP